MKFSDTLATLQYMGGTIPNHFSMLLYGIYAWQDYYEALDCNKIRAEKFPNLAPFKIRPYDNAIVDMIYVHSICILIYFGAKLLSKKNDYASYVKTTLKVFRITVYFMGFMKVILSALQPLTEDEKMCGTMSVDDG